MALVLKEKIVLSTPQGESEVQLLFGDITSLPMEEKVDAIFVSSFPGDYVAAPTSLIGALKRNLGIEVGKLAQNKEINLLHNFSCWVSSPLPEDKPFRRLVCFERKASQSMVAQISGIFRAMMPIFSNQDTSVITPLLATGNQSHSKTEVLKSIVSGACHWIKAGLWLKCLKIVVYTPNGHSVPESDVKLVTQFQEYKKKWEKKTEKKMDVQKKQYDVCMSYATADKGLIGEIFSGLQKAHTNIVIFKDQFTYNYKSVWQKQISDIMMNSRRIIAVLTPNYLDNVECLDQFNIALCCNRQTGSDMLVPFYLQTVASFPSYMMLIQYTDCRVRKEGDVKEEKIISACSVLVEELERDERQQQQQLQTQTKKKDDDTAAALGDETASYDIFISYAHRTPKEAGLMYEALQEADASLKIFLDRNELRTGNVWQEALYEAVDRASLVVAFISSSYLQSTVCQEEYNIALARYLSQDGLCLLPVLIEDMAEIPSSFALTPLVDLRDPEKREDGKTYSRLAEILIGYLDKSEHNQFTQPEEKVSKVHILDEWRRHQFRQRFQANKTDIIQLKEPNPPSQPTPANDSHVSSDRASNRASSEEKTGVTTSKKVASNGAAVGAKTVAVSCTSDCLNQALILGHLLKNRHPKGGEEAVTVEFLASQQAQASSRLLDSADMVVVFVSDDYMASVQHRTELHMALCRQRVTKDRPVVYLIEANHSMAFPAYPYLLPYSVSLGDRHWFSLAREVGKLKSKESFRVQHADDMDMRVYCTGLEYMALMTAAVDLTDKLVNSGADRTSNMLTNIVNLASAKRLGEPGMEPVEKCLVPFSTLKTKKIEIISAWGAPSWSVNTHHIEKARKQAQVLAQLASEGHGDDAREDSQRHLTQKRSSACQLL